MLQDHCYAFVGFFFFAVAFRFEDVFIEEGDPMTFFCPALGPTLNRYGQNTFMLVRGHEHFITTKFRKHPSVVEADYVFPYKNMH